MSFAFFFPGQGAQKLDMMSGFSGIDMVQKTFAEASSVLGVDLWRVLTGSDAAVLNQTLITQPLMLTVGVATYRAYLQEGGQLPSFLAGHSLGEYTALVAADALDFLEAVKLVQLRAQLMQEVVLEGTGAMAAILGLEDDKVREVCQEASSQNLGLVEAANYNSMHQIVISGETKAVELAMEIAKDKGAKKSVRLDVSVPSHCRLMKPAADELALVLEKSSLRVPKIKVIHNADVKFHDSSEAIKNVLVKQLYSPVYWTDTVLALVKLGVTEAVECAPSRILTDLNKRISKEITGRSFLTIENIRTWIKENNQSSD